MRLIDADALKVKQQEDADLFKGDDTLSGKSRRDEALNAVANIVNAPTIDPVRHGHWERYLEVGLKWRCSECASRFTTPFSYCPNCGAKNEVKENED